MTTWGQNYSPWNEIDWNNIIIIDEPVLPFWGWPGDLLNKDDVCGEIGLKAVQGRIDRAKAQGYKVWLNYSSEEWVSVVNLCTENYPGLNADILSIDSYGGVWDWEIHTRWYLDHVYRSLAPGQLMGLVPEGHTLVGSHLDYPEIDYVQIGTLYFDWAMRRDDSGRIFALAPFYWDSFPAGQGYPEMIGIKDKPGLIELYKNLAAKYPRCEE